VSKSAEKIRRYLSDHKALFFFMVLYLSVFQFSVSRFLFMLLQTERGGNLLCDDRGSAGCDEHLS
jgi:hypothetical protein